MRISIAMGVDTADLVTDMRRAQREVDKRTKEMQKAARAAGVAIGAALAAGATAAAYALKKAIDRADELSKTAQKIGVTTEALSRLEYAAGRSGLSLGQLATGVGKLSQNMAAAVSGNTALAGAFDAIGVSVTRADGSLRNADDVLLDLADVFQKLPDGADQTALAMQLMGKSGRDMIPLLNGGSKSITELTDRAEQLGLVVTTTAGQQAEAFNDALGDLGQTALGVANSVGAELVPQLTAFAEQINSPAFRDGIGAIITGAVNATAALVGMVAELGNVARFAGEEVAARINGPSPDDIRRLKLEYQDLFAELSRLNAAEANDAFGSSVSAEYKQGIVDRMSAIQELIKQDEILRAQRQQSGQEQAAADEADIGALEVKTSAVGDLQARLQEYYRSLQTGAGVARENADAERDSAQAMQDQVDAWDDALRASHEFDRATEALRAQLAGPMAQAWLGYRENVAEVNELLGSGVITTDQAQERFALLADEITRLSAETENQNTHAEDMLESLRFEASLIGLTNAQREREIALRQLGAEATAEQRAEVLALIAALQEEYKNGNIAQAFQDSLDDAKQGIADSLEDAIFDGADAGFDSAKRVFEQFARDMVRQQIIIPIQARMSGGLSGGDLFSTAGNTGMGYLSSAVGGYGMGRSIGGTAGGNVGAALGIAGYAIGGPVGAAIGSIIGGLIGSLNSKPPDIRLGGATGNVRKPEGSTSTSFGTLIYGARGLEGAESEFVQSIADFDKTIYDLVSSTSTGVEQIDAITAALSSWSVDLKGDNVTAENILGSRFDAILSTYDQATQDYVNGATTLEDRVARFEEAVLRPDRLNALMSQISTAAAEAGMTPFAAAMAQINSEFDAAIDAAEQLGASEAQLAEIEGYRADAIERLRAEGAQQYAGAVGDIDAQIAALEAGSEFQASLRDIATEYNDNVAALNEAAQAAGLAAAREQDLAKALKLATIQRQRAIAALQAEGQQLAQSLGYTALSGIDAQIAALQAQEDAATSAVQSFGEAMGDAASSAMDAINLLLGDLSPYKDREKLAMALQAQQQGLVGPEDVLRIAQRLFASGTDYNQVFAQVMAIGDRRSSGSVGGYSGGAVASGVSPEMQALLDERAAMVAEQEAAQRRVQAGDLAQIIADIAGAQGITFAEAAEQLGIADMSALAGDLGVTMDALSDYLTALQADSYSIEDIAGTITAGDQAIIDALFELFGDPSTGGGLRSNAISDLQPDADGKVPISTDEPLPIEPAPIVDPIIEHGDRVAKSIEDGNDALIAEVQAMNMALADLLARVASNTDALPQMAGIAAATQSAATAAAPRSKRLPV